MPTNVQVCAKMLPSDRGDNTTADTIPGDSGDTTAHHSALLKMSNEQTATMMKLKTLGLALDYIQMFKMSDISMIRPMIAPRDPGDLAAIIAESAPKEDDDAEELSLEEEECYHSILKFVERSFTAFTKEYD